MDEQKITEVVDAIAQWESAKTPMPQVVFDFLNVSHINTEYISEIVKAPNIKQKLEVASKIYNLKTINAINLSRGIVNWHYNSHKNSLNMVVGIAVVGLIVIGFDVWFLIPLIPSHPGSKEFLLAPGVLGMIACFLCTLASIETIVYLLRMKFWKYQHS